MDDSRYIEKLNSREKIQWISVADKVNELVDYVNKQIKKEIEHGSRR